MNPNDPLWVAIPPTDPLSATAHGEHKVEFVSRHSIAECGLVCPACHNEVAPLGDYTMVRHCRLGDVIRCNGQRTIQDNVVTCGMFLVASPDTEHGDHLIYDKVPPDERLDLFCRFVRISEGDAVKRKYGHDVQLNEHGQMVVVGDPEKPVAPKLPTLPLAAGQLWLVDDGRVFQITRVQNTGDALYDGWAWGIFQNEDGIEWNVDPTGLIRQTMRDPTRNDKLRLTTEVRAN